MKIAQQFIAGERCPDVLSSPVGMIEQFSHPDGTQMIIPLASQQ
jgi:hypothetical protein